VTLRVTPKPQGISEHVVQVVKVIVAQKVKGFHGDGPLLVRHGEVKDG
jgi:hypothetical protein